MRRGTTPVHKFKVDIDFEGLEAAYITYVQNKQTVLEKTINDITVNMETKTIIVSLTQADTLLFSSGPSDLTAVFQSGVNYKKRN